MCVCVVCVFCFVIAARKVARGICCGKVSRKTRREIKRSERDDADGARIARKNVNLVSHTHNFSRALPEVTLTCAGMGELEPRTVN